ncbi:MAG: hypothetical protein QOD77_753 [Thermoplasmata archaeon]|jgi:hypothetical protein|nr:hypothetical protein [Thermoplasmata archaeon]
MRNNHRTTAAALVTALAFSLGALAHLPLPAAGAYLAPSQSATISSDPVNGTDFTTGYDPDVRNQDGTLIGDGVEPVPGATGKLVNGQFGWLKGTGKHILSPQESLDGQLSELRLVPGLGWFWSIDRPSQISDDDLHTSEVATATLSPVAGEYLRVSLSWSSPTCGASYTQRDIWNAGAPMSGLKLGVFYQKDPVNFMDNPNNVEEVANMRHDRLVLNVDATPASALCQATVEYAFNLRFVFETSYISPWDGTGALSNLGAQREEMRAWVVQPGATQAPATASQPSDVLYAPVIPLVWVCSELPREAPDACAQTAMANARAGGPKAVVFPDPTNGWHTLVMKVYPTGVVQGSRTYVPDPYTSYTVTRTRLATLDSLNYYNEQPWPFAPMYT